MNVNKHLVERNGERGASLVEYGLLLALIVVVCIAALQFLGQSVSQNFSAVASAL